jgi:hypothetical protein
VWVGEEMVAKKDLHGFPSDRDVLAAVQRALGTRSPSGITRTSS